MKNVSKNLLECSFVLFVLIVLISVVVGMRDFSIGSDTVSYASYFIGSTQLGYAAGYEVGFNFLVTLLINIGANVEFYFAAISVVVTSVYIVSFSNFFRKGIHSVSGVEMATFVYFLMATLLFSSWYFTSIVNGLRNGLALPFLYLSMLYFFKNKYFSLLSFVVSFSFHKSVILILPFFALLNLKINTLLGIFFVLLVGYYFGINENVVKIVSNLIGISLYNEIKFYYPTSTVRWLGFQMDFVLYTSFWAVFFLSLRRFIKLRYTYIFEVFMKIYITLVCSYFVFGFGAFSNRYAYAAWFFIPALQAVFLSAIKLNIKAKFTISFFMLVIGFLFFVNRFIV